MNKKFKADPTPEQIIDMQTSDDSNAECAKRLGLHHKTVGKYRSVPSPDDSKDRPALTFNKIVPPILEGTQPLSEDTKSQLDDLVGGVDVNIDVALPPEPETIEDLVDAMPKPKGHQAKHFPTTVYRDGENGTIERLNCDDGWIPDGWHDSPSDCENCPGHHINYVQVKPNKGSLPGVYEKV